MQQTNSTTENADTNIHIVNTAPAPVVQPPAPVIVQAPAQPPAPANDHHHDHPITINNTATANPVAEAHPTAVAEPGHAMASAGAGGAAGAHAAGRGDMSRHPAPGMKRKILWGNVAKIAALTALVLVGAWLAYIFVGGAIGGLLIAMNGAPVIGPILGGIETAVGWVGTTIMSGISAAGNLLASAWQGMIGAGAAEAAVAPAVQGATPAAIQSFSNALGLASVGVVGGVGAAHVMNTMHDTPFAAQAPADSVVVGPHHDHGAHNVSTTQKMSQHVVDDVNHDPVGSQQQSGTRFRDRHASNALLNASWAERTGHAQPAAIEARNAPFTQQLEAERQSAQSQSVTVA